MRTTIKQQMAAIKKAMKVISDEYKWRKTLKDKIKHYTESQQWIALNDAYSTLAAVAIMAESVPKNVGKPYKSNAVS